MMQKFTIRRMKAGKYCYPLFKKNWGRGLVEKIVQLCFIQSKDQTELMFIQLGLQDMKADGMWKRKI